METTPAIPKTTKGHLKMQQYLSDLIRNKNFQRILKRYRRLLRKEKMPSGNYNDWTKEQRDRHDYIDKEIAEIIDEYRLLSRRCRKLFKSQKSNIEETLGELYYLDRELLGYLVGTVEGKEILLEYFSDDVEMCRIEPLADDALSPTNEGEDFLHLRPDKRLHLLAYPIAIGLHRKTSKRDVIDYIEKRWAFIEPLLEKGEKEPRIRKRKYAQEMLDFIWKHHSKPAKDIKKILEKYFPKNGLAYWEISDIVKFEKRKRFRDLT